MITIKFNKNSTLLKGGLFSIFSFFNKGLNFLLLIVIANFLTPDAYGELSLFTTLLTLIGYVICLSGEGYAAISFFKESEQQYKRTISSMFALPFVVLLILCCFVTISSMFTNRLFDLAIKDVYYALFISTFTIYVNLVLDYFRVKEKILTYGMISCSYALLNFVFTLILITVLQIGWYGRVYSLLFMSVIYSLFSWFVFVKEKRFSLHSISLFTIRKIILWGFPLIPHLASTWIKQGGDRYIIKANYDMTEVGIFSFALNLANIMCMVGVAFNSSNSVDIYKSLSTPTDKTISKLYAYTKKMLCIYAIISIIVLLVFIPLIHLLLHQYISSLAYFSLLLPYGYLQCIYFLYCNYLFFYGQNKQIMNITFSTSIIHLVLSLLLTRYSLYATAVVYTLTQLLVILFLRIKVSKLLNAKFADYKSNIIL